jgi:TonB family protein
MRTDLPDAGARGAPTSLWWPVSIDLRRPRELPEGSLPSESIVFRPLPVAAPPPRRGGDRTIWSISFAGAIAAHAAVLLMFAIVGPPEPSGGGGQLLEAISVEIVHTRVTEARDPQPTEVMAAASGPLAPEGDQVQPAELARAEPRQTEPDRPQLIGAEKPDTQVVAEEPAPTKAEPEPPKVTQLEETDQEKTPAPESRTQGGVAALTVEGDRPASARASASPGAMQKYAMQVRAALARNKPDGHGTRGTAMVAFGITESGKVRFARLSNSSGSAALDKAALAAVSRTPFPVPPQGMTEAELTYAVPFHFK